VPEPLPFMTILLLEIRITSAGSSATIPNSVGSASLTINLPGGKNMIPPLGFASAAAIAAFIAYLSEILSSATAPYRASVTSYICCENTVGKPVSPL
tara:strand:- start:1321 stop:1611 length:291 start_codon:yes stop_codon:yes gene_type:complete